MAITLPGVTVNVSTANPVPGAPTATGRVFVAYANAAVLTPSQGNVFIAKKGADAIAAGAPSDVGDVIDVLLALGAPDVVITNTTAVSYTAPTSTEWGVGLANFTADLGPGRVLIFHSASASSNAYTALLTFVQSSNHTAYLDGGIGGTGASALNAATVASTAAGLAANAGAKYAGMFVPGVNVPRSSGSTSPMPASVIAAGVAAGLDAKVGNAGRKPEWSFGVIGSALSVAQVFSDADVSTLTTGAVNVVRPITQLGSVVALNSYNSLAATDVIMVAFERANFVMQVKAGLMARGAFYIGRPKDAKGSLFTEVLTALNGYLTPFSGPNQPLSKFTLQCDFNNNTLTDNALNINVGLWFAGVAEAVTFNLALSI